MLSACQCIGNVEKGKVLQDISNFQPQNLKTQMAKMENVSISFKYVIHFEFIALLANFWSKFKPFLSHIVAGKAPPQKRFSLFPNQILLGNMSQLNAASAELLSRAH